jgi:hypothetical protein
MQDNIAAAPAQPKDWMMAFFCERKRVMFIRDGISRGECCRDRRFFSPPEAEAADNVIALPTVEPPDHGGNGNDNGQDFETADEELAADIEFADAKLAADPLANHPLLLPVYEAIANAKGPAAKLEALIKGAASLAVPLFHKLIRERDDVLDHLIERAYSVGLIKDDFDRRMVEEKVAYQLDNPELVAEQPQPQPTDAPPLEQVEGRPSNEARQPDVTRPIIKSSAEFVAGFVPPEYVVVGLLQRRFFYSLTALTGHGKTAIMLVLTACAALGKLFAGKETKQIRVLYLAAENADDVRMRWITLAERMDFDVNTIEVYFVEGRFQLSKSLKLLRAEANRRGGEFGLVIVDTGPTFFEGKEENENKQLGDHARLLRSLIDTIPGGPCVVAACHPTKNAKADELLPRGGGAYLAETDGNLTCWKTDSAVELHWQGKFRGPDFAPMNFLIKTVTHQDLKDSDGRLIPTVIAEYISEQAKEDIAAAARENEKRALKFISDNPSSTLSTLATAIGWKLHSGEPNKMKAKRIVDELKRTKLIKETRAGRYKITDQGKNALKGEAD